MKTENILIMEDECSSVWAVFFLITLRDPDKTMGVTLFKYCMCLPWLKNSWERERERVPPSVPPIKIWGLWPRVLGVTGVVQDGDPSNGPGKTQADQHQRDRRCGECGGAKEGLQPAPALHAGQRQERRDAAGLLFRSRAYGSWSSGGPLDPNTAVLLWGRPEGKSRKKSHKRYFSNFDYY